MKKSLEQRRALYALRCVQAIIGGGLAENYRRQVESLPVTILQLGLGQAIALQLAAQDAAQNRLVKDLSGWLCGDDEAAPYRGYDQKGKSNIELLSAIMEHDERTYLRASREALALASWLKRFARALLTSGTEGS
jgi:CRISPR-associated protein Cmr5